MADNSTTPSVKVEAAESESTAESVAKSEPTLEKKDDPVHPHLEEIMKGPNDWQLKKQEPIPYKSLEETPFTIVDSKELLGEMMTKLKTEKEIAVSVKGSNYRSFRKKNCLVQIATRSEVFLVDTIALKEDIQVLNEVFTNREILKVGHTKDNYCRDFQKDLGLYVVNMFCLPLAGKMLSQSTSADGKKIGKSYKFLQALLKDQCGVDYSDSYKGLQEWHERPLTDEYVKCAQMSVQYLLHIYDKFRNKLIEQNLLDEVYKQCNEMCKAIWNPDKNVSVSRAGAPHLWFYKKLGSKWPSSKELNKVQFEVFRVLYDWRHTTAEKNDEGHSYLLKDQAIYDIAKALPKDAEGIRKCLSPDTPCSLLEENMDSLIELIVKEVKSQSGTPNADDKVPFNPNAKSDAGKKRRFFGEKGSHLKDQTHQKKNKLQQYYGPRPYFHGRGAPHFGRPHYPMNPMMGPPMGFMGPPMGFMGPRGMPRGMRMRMPPRPFGW